MSKDSIWDLPAVSWDTPATATPLADIRTVTVRGREQSVDSDYRLIAVKRDWIPEWLYALIVRSFWRPLCVRQPLRWVLHREVIGEECGG